VRYQRQLMAYAGEALTAPKSFLQAGLGGAIEGGVTEAVRPDATLGSVAMHTGVGAGAAGVGDKLLRPLTGGVRVNPRAQNLLDEGANLTTGGRLGPRWRAAEDKMTSVPLLGDSIIGAKNVEKDSFNRLLVDDALGAIGNKLPDDIPVGHEAIYHADQAISKRYEDVLDNMTVTKDKQFYDEIDHLKSMSRSLPKKERKAFIDTLDEAFDPDISGGSDLLLGQTYKDVFRRVRDKSKQFLGSTDGFQQDLGAALHETALSLKDLGIRQNPIQAPRLLATDKAFAKMETVRTAAEKVGAEDNIVSAAQYLNSVVKNADGKTYSRGQAFNQGLAQDAKHIMAQKIPDSGTAGRLAMTALLGGGGAVAAATNPAATAMAVAPALVGAAAYTQPGQRLVNNLMFENADNAMRNAYGPLRGILSSSTATEALRGDTP